MIFVELSQAFFKNLLFGAEIMDKNGYIPPNQL